MRRSALLTFRQLQDRLNHVRWFYKRFFSGRNVQELLRSELVYTVWQKAVALVWCIQDALQSCCMYDALQRCVWTAFAWLCAHSECTQREVPKYAVV